MLLTLIFTVLQLVLLTGCKTKSKNLYGNWAIIELVHDNQEIFPVYDKKFIPAPTLTIGTNKSIIIDLHQGDKSYGDFKHYFDNEVEVVKIFNMKDQRFNGTYQLSIELSVGTKTSNYKEFEMILESDSIYIRAIKSVVRLL